MMDQLHYLESVYTSIEDLYECCIKLNYRNELKASLFGLAQMPIVIYLIGKNNSCVRSFVNQMNFLKNSDLKRLIPEFILFDGYPVLKKARRKPDALWIIFSSDRYELLSKDFLTWSQENIDIFRKISVVGLQFFPLKELDSHPHFIKVTQETCSAGKNIDILPLPWTDEESEFHEQIKILLIGLVMQIYLISSDILDCNSLVETFKKNIQDIAQCCLNDDRVLIKNGRFKTEIAFQKLKKLMVLRSQFKQMEIIFSQFADSTKKLYKIKDVNEIIAKTAGSIANDLNSRRFLGNAPESVSVSYNDSNFMRFSKEYQKTQKKLIGFINKISEELKKNKELAEAERFESVKEDIRRNLMVILLGCFSSGKSTFLNTLLGVGDSLTALPTSGKPKTATINILEHTSDSNESAVPEYHRDKINLELFKDNKLNLETDVYRVCNEQLKALLKWREFGLPEINNVEVYRLNQELKHGGLKNFKNRRTLIQKDQSKLISIDYDLFKKIIDNDVKYFDKNKLHEQNAPFKVEKMCFNHNSPVFKKYFKPPNNSVRETLEFFERPEFALAVNCINIKRSFDKLEGVCFVDTPGTDSNVAYHHTLAKDFIEHNPGAIILYFFDAHSAASNDDNDNLCFLTDQNVKAVDRSFFLINKRDYNKLSDPKEEEENHKETVDKINKALEKAKIKNRPLYLIDSKTVREKPEDAEWNRLMNDLCDFTTEYRNDYLKCIADKQIKKRMNDFLNSNNEQLANLNKNSRERELLSEEKEKEIQNIKEIQKQLNKEFSDIKKRLFKKEFHNDLLEIFKEIKNELSSFETSVYFTKTKNEKIKEINNILKPLYRVPDDLKTNLDRNTLYLHEYLKKIFADYELSFSIPRHNSPSGFVAFSTRKIKDRANEDITIRNIFKMYSAWLKSKVQDLILLIDNTLNDARRNVDAAFETGIKFYSLELTNIQRILENEVKSLREKSVEDEIRVTKSKINLYSKWLNEYDELINNQSPETLS